MLIQKEDLNTIALICFLIGVGLYVINYFFFHYVSKNGFSKEKLKEAGKPFIANLIGLLSTLFFFTGLLSWIVTAVVF